MRLGILRVDTRSRRGGMPERPESIGAVGYVLGSARHECRGSGGR